MKNETMVKQFKQILSAACAALLAVCAPGALAGTLGVRIVDAAGKPVIDAVVTLRPVNGTAPAPKPDRPYRVIQQNIAFKPFVSIVPVGGTVAFPNFDPVRHHVYSFSKAKRFELKLFAKDQTRSVTFDRAGIVAIGCNIHDAMSAYIFVTDTVWTGRSSASGAVSFGTTPGGAYIIQVWHPNLRAPGGFLSKTVAGGADRTETFKVALRPPAMNHMNGY